MKTSTLITLLMFATCCAHAQPENACSNLDKILAAIHKQDLNSGLQGEFVDETSDHSTYECTVSLNPESTGYITTLADEMTPVYYEEQLCGFTTRSEAEKIYFDYVTALKKNCLGDKLQEIDNPAPKPGEALKMAIFQPTETLVFKLFFIEENDGMSLDPLDPEYFYVMVEVGNP